MYGEEAALQPQTGEADEKDTASTIYTQQASCNGQRAREMVVVEEESGQARRNKEK